MALVYVTRKTAKIVTKKPENSIKTGNTKHLLWYIKGGQRFVKARKGSSVRYD